MLANIASFFWGSNPVESQTCSVDPISEGLFHEVRPDDCVPENGAPFEAILATPHSLSDEETGWVLVDNHKQVPEICQEKSVKKPESKRRKSTKLKGGSDADSNKNHQSVARQRTIPNSALTSSNVVQALAELKPQHRASERQREFRLNSKQMERSNKTLLVNSSSNRPAKRRSMYNAKMFSNAVNNRKC